MRNSDPRRVDGYLPLEQYAVLGDGRTVALVGSDGQIDWWPFPTLDSPPICAAILDPLNGGHFSLCPQGSYDAKRRYVDGTNVLETTYITATGQAKVTQALNTGSAGRLPWTELAHRVEGVLGTVEMEWDFLPGNRFGKAQSWVTQFNGTSIATVGNQTLGLVVQGTGASETLAHRAKGTFVAKRGERAVLAVVGTDNEPLFVPSAASIDARLDRTISDWQRWTGLLDTDSPYAAAVERSALALKTLIAEWTGAIAAAGTTSLPETLGGAKNWDYRYAWLRDSSFTANALLNLGLHEEVHGAVSWLLGALRRNGGKLRVFYSLSGNVADDEAIVDAPGYRKSQPVREGNGASEQLQLGTYGDLFATIHRYVDEGHLIDPGTGRLLADLADECCDHWKIPDSGIWELAQIEHYTISKIGCWVALDRAQSLAENGHIPDDGADRWRSEAAEIQQWVNGHCWSDSRKSYTSYAGSEELDAAVLLCGRTGFDRGPRLTSTIEAVVAELGEGPYLYRYSGMRDEEGAFIACTFWLVDALVHTGQLSRATELMDQAIGLSNDVGVFSEQADPATGAFLGNIPQGLSHLALINAAFALRNAQ